MNTETPNQAAASAPSSTVQWWSLLFDACLGGSRNNHERIDDATLRDLGVQFSEFDSYAAESEGRAERTRQRVA